MKLNKQRTLASSSNPEKIVTFSGWLFAILGIIASGVTLMLILMWDVIKNLWTVNPEYPFLQNLFHNLPVLLGILGIFFVLCTLTGLGLIKKISWTWWLFLALNWAIILGNGLTLWYMMHVHVEMKRFLLWVGVPIDSAMEVVRFLEYSDYFQMIFFSVVHLWIIWRFLRDDVRRLFLIPNEKKIEIEQGIH